MKYSLHHTNSYNQSSIRIKNPFIFQSKIISSKYYKPQVYVYQLQLITHYLNILNKSQSHCNKKKGTHFHHYNIFNKHNNNQSYILNKSYILPIQSYRKLKFLQSVNLNQPFQYLVKYHNMNHIKNIITHSINQSLKQDSLYPLILSYLQIIQQFKFQHKNNNNSNNSKVNSYSFKKLILEDQFKNNLQHKKTSQFKQYNSQNVSDLQLNSISNSHLNEKSLLYQILEQLARDSVISSSIILSGNLDYLDFNCQQLIESNNQKYKDQDPASKISTQNTNPHIVQSQQIYGLIHFKPKSKKQSKIQKNQKIYSSNSSSIQNFKPKQIKKHYIQAQNIKYKQPQLRKTSISRKHLSSKISSKDLKQRSNQKAFKKSIESKSQKKKLSSSKSKKFLKMH